jgi:hypothetical protein
VKRKSGGEEAWICAASVIYHENEATYSLGFSAWNTLPITPKEASFAHFLDAFSGVPVAACPTKDIFWQQPLANFRRKRTDRGSNPGLSKSSERALPLRYPANSNISFRLKKRLVREMMMAKQVPECSIVLSHSRHTI